MDAVKVRGINLLLLFFLLLHLKKKKKKSHTALFGTVSFFWRQKSRSTTLTWWNHKLTALQRTQNCTDAVADLTG